jgi:PAS domain S-box-containing protein
MPHSPSADLPGAKLGQTQNPSAALRAAERLDALRRTGLLDSPLNPAFDRLTRLTCRLVGAPAALVTLMDTGRQFLLSQHGLEPPWSGVREIPAEYVFCRHAVAARAPVVVVDARMDPVSREDPAIAELGVVAYAGAPLLTEDGVALGSLSVIEYEPRRWTTEELASLQDLAAIATTEINARLAAAAGGRGLISGMDPRLAYGALPVMLWTAGPDYGCDYFNDRWLQFTGRTLEQELGWGWAERLHPEDRDPAKAAYLEAFDARTPFSIEYRYQRFDGAWRWLLDTAVPRFGADGDFLGYVGCCADVTDRRSLEHRLQQVERTEAIVQLAGGIAHDYNNLLTGIIGHVTLLLEDDTLSPEAREDLDQIQQSADRAATLTRQLLAYSRRQVLAPRILDLNQLVAGTVSAIRRIVGNRVQVIQNLDPRLDSVLADPGQMEQILLQLSANARESMADGGRLELQTGVVEIDEETAQRLPGLEPGSYVTLSVSDTGRGMDETTLERIFDPFFSTKSPSQGAGLGLPAVYGIVKQSGGYIDVGSAPGEGTTFTVYLPRLESVISERGAEPARLSGTETVLVVEDETQVRELARRVLERSGYTVITAVDAESAIALSDRHAGHIHLLVTDMALPRVSGRELAARLGIHRPAIKVLYVSGTSDGAIARHRMLEPGTEFLEKPFSLERLLRKVRQVLGAPEVGRSA